MAHMARKRTGTDQPSTLPLLQNSNEAVRRLGRLFQQRFLGRGDDDVAGRVLTLGPSSDTIDLIHSVVNDFAIRC
jgi:hypothetical protein